MEIVRVGKVVFIARGARSRADRQITAITASKLKGLKSANPGLTIKIIPKKTIHFCVNLKNKIKKNTIHLTKSLIKK